MRDPQRFKNPHLDKSSMGKVFVESPCACYLELADIVADLKQELQKHTVDKDRLWAWTQRLQVVVDVLNVWSLNIARGEIHINVSDKLQKHYYFD